MSRKSTIDVIGAGSNDIAAANAAADVAATTRSPRVMLKVAVGNISLTRASTGAAQLTVGLQVDGAKTAHVYLSLTDSAYPFTIATLERAWGAYPPDALFELDDEAGRVAGIVQWLQPLDKPTCAQAFVDDDGNWELPWGRKYELLF